MKDSNLINRPIEILQVYPIESGLMPKREYNKA